MTHQSRIRYPEIFDPQTALEEKLRERKYPQEILVQRRWWHRHEFFKAPTREINSFNLVDRNRKEKTVLIVNRTSIHIIRIRFAKTSDIGSQFLFICPHIQPIHLSSHDETIRKSTALYSCGRNIFWLN